MKWRAIAGIVALLLVILLGIGLVRDWRLDSDFPAIRAKSNEIQVKDLMGEPHEVDRPCQAAGVAGENTVRAALHEVSGFVVVTRRLYARGRDVKKPRPWRRTRLNP